MEITIRNQYHAQMDIKDNTKFGEPLFTIQVRNFSLSTAHFKGRENWSLTWKKDHKVWQSFSHKYKYTYIHTYIHTYIIVHTYFLTLHNKHLYILQVAGIATRLQAGPSGHQFSAVPREYSPPKNFQVRSRNHPAIYS